MKKSLLRTKKFFAVVALAAVSMNVAAQSSDARYPVGVWQTDVSGEGPEPVFFVNLNIERAKDGDNSISITNFETDEEVFAGSLTYTGKEMKDGLPTGTYFFDVETNKGKRCTININGSRKPLIIGTGELKDHPAFKNDIVFIPGALASTGGEVFGLYCKTEKELLSDLRLAVRDQRHPTVGFGNLQQFINAHANLDPTKPKYLKPKGAGTINIREKASTTATKVGELKAGQTLLVLDEFDGWCQVQLDENKKGWVSLSVVTLTNTPGAAPAAGGTAATSFVLGDGKLGPLSIGQTVASLPKSVAGLYDRYQVKEQEFGDEEGTWTETYCFFYKAGKAIFKACVDDGKRLTSFVLEAGSSFIKTPEGFFVGCSAREVFSKKRMEWETWYTGTTFARSGHWEYHIPSEGLNGADTPSKLADIKTSAKISMIVYYKNLPE